MPLDFDPTGDFSTMVDAAQPLTLLRRGSASSIAIPTAWRSSARYAESDPAGGYVVVGDVVWQFEWPEGTLLPQLGDRLRDSAGECHTVLAVEQTQGSTRLKCEARSLRIAYGLDGLVKIEQAVWEDLGSGDEITGWTPYRPAVDARIQPIGTTVDETTDPITSVATYRITLDDDTPLDHNHRIVGGDGMIYRLLSYTGAERIGQLPVAVVRREG